MACRVKPCHVSGRHRQFKIRPQGVPRRDDKGDKLVRHVLVEASHSYVRFVPGSRLSQFLPAHKRKAGCLQGGSRDGGKDDARHASDAQGRE